MYVGRFAPSPTGPLHAGSLVAALASWLDARAHAGRWLVRIEDVDTPRCAAGADRLILDQLHACGLVPDGEVVWQHLRGDLYGRALGRLEAAGHAYPCGCSRREIDAAQQRLRHRHGELVYPGTCRDGLHGKPPGATRLLTSTVDGSDIVVDWTDRRLGALSQNLTQEVGDFVLRRADGCWAYQLAAVFDDALQGVTHVVRGEDLADNTPRQIHLQRLLGLPTPAYLHAPLVRAVDGQKLSKQNGAAALDLRDPIAALATAGAVLGLQVDAVTPAEWLAEATRRWAGAWSTTG